jgi:hypothetical protein
LDFFRLPAEKKINYLNEILFFLDYKFLEIVENSALETSINFPAQVKNYIFASPIKKYKSLILEYFGV